MAGIIHFRGDPPLRDQARQLSVGVAHRGSDDKGFWKEGPAVLVHRRFATLRSQVAEPYAAEGLVLMADGRPHDLGTDKVHELWSRANTGCLDQLMGEFALVVWDTRRQELFLIRDPVGSKPLYWARSGDGKVAFCSEVGPLLGLPWVSRELAHDHVAEFLSFRYVHAPRTLLRDVRAVPPGSVLRIDAHGVSCERWWQPPWAPPGTPIPDANELSRDIDDLLRRNVQRRIVGPSDVAVLLSGGLDSSAILFHARELKQEVRAFTVAMADDPVDESAFAARVAKVLDTEHHLVRIENDQLMDALHTCAKAMGQPLASAAGVIQYLLFQEIRPTSRIVLSGEGGDEVLGGRGMERIAARLRRNRVFGLATGPSRRVMRRAAARFGLQDLAARTSQFGRDRTIGGSTVFDDEERVALLRDPALVRPSIRNTVLEPYYQEVDSDPINDILHTWQRGWLPEDTLARSDRMSASLGLDLRTPLLDPTMLARTCALPGGAKVRPKGPGFMTKAPLRMAMERRLPPQLVNRPKRALPNPLNRWLRESGATFLQARVDAICNDDTGLFVPREVRRLAREHQSGKADHGLKLWTLALFQLWRETTRV